MSDNSKRNGIIAAVLLVTAGGIGYTNLKRYTPGPEINNGHGGDEITPQDRAEFQKMALIARISPEQQRKLEAIREKGGDRRELRTQVADVLTSTQRHSMREQMMGRRAEREAKMKAAMGPADYKRFQEKMKDRFGPDGRRGGRRGERGQNQGGRQV